MDIEEGRETMKPRMFYFGPWDVAGHYMRSDNYPPQDLKESRAISHFTAGNPWGYRIDGGLCPDTGEGLALLHQKDGWTVLSFRDYTVDIRFGSNSNYLAEGTFTFEQMVEMAKTRFAYRWNMMKFEVKLIETK